MSGKTEVRLFDHTTPQIAITDAYFVDVNPTTAIGSEKSDIEFFLSGSGSEYYDLNDTLLTVVVQIFNKDGAKFDGDIPVTPVNHFMNSLFTDIKCQLNDTIIEGGNEYYPWKATIEDMFNFDRPTKNIQLRPKGYERDAAKRKKWFYGSKPVEFSGAIRLNFFNQPKYLLPGVDVRLTLKRAASSFSCMASGAETGEEEVMIIIKSAKLRVRKAQVNPSVEWGHNLGLENKNAIYQFVVAKIVKHQINIGMYEYVKDNVFSSPLMPKYIVLGLVKQSAYSGSNTKDDPFNFQPFGVRRLALYVDGSSAPYRSGYEPNFDIPMVSDVFMRSIVQSEGNYNKNLNNGITIDDFTKGPATFYTFNLTPDYSIAQKQFPKSSPVRLDISFKKPIEEPINVIIYALFDSQLEITKNRDINCGSHVF